MGRKRMEITGRKFTRLTVIRFSHVDKRQQSYWMCLCDCGNEKVIRGRSLLSKQSQSCGCYCVEVATSLNTKHKLSTHPLFNTWTHLRQRCNNPLDKQYKDYGGRGISVCNEWQRDFMKFYTWCIANGYKRGLQIDRRNNNEGYSPDNCRWVTAKVNMRNTRSTQLTEEKARQIRELYSQRVRQRKIAEIFSVSEGIIQSVVKGRTWV